MVEDDKIVSRDGQIVKKFSEYFISLPILNMSSNGYKYTDSSEQGPILKILDKFKDHSSIKLIKAKTTLKFLSSVKLTSKKSKNLSKGLTRKKLHKRMILKPIY